MTAMPLPSVSIRHSEMKHKEKGSDHILRRFSISYVHSSAYGTHFTLRVSKPGMKVLQEGMDFSRSQRQHRLQAHWKTQDMSMTMFNHKQLRRICTSPLVEESHKSGSRGTQNRGFMAARE